MRHVCSHVFPSGKALASLFLCMVMGTVLMASSHREAPLIADDPLADNTDLYAFRSPDNPDMITIIANYVPFQAPQGGPNYYGFGEQIRYEIHIDNDISTPGDDIIYRFTFRKEFEDPSTFFYIRLGLENHKTTYTMERSTDGGNSFEIIIENGVVPPNNIGDRSITGFAGLSTDYESLFTNAISTAATGEQVFCGPVDDPFFVDLGGVFDLGDLPRQNSGRPRDGVGCLNVSTIALQIPIAQLQKDGKSVNEAANILDSDFVIGVWASASRRMVRTLQPLGEVSESGDWVQVSRLGMPLTNEVVIPIGMKDYWNALTPYEDLATIGDFGNFFYNPELGLYMDDDQFGGAVPAFASLRIQRNSLGAFDFGNGQDGLFPLKGDPALAGTALDDAVFGELLLPGPGSPRSVDLWPAFHTGVPNIIPYQLATGKNGNPLAEGKPFVNNFLPNGGDMLRLNMAVPPTPRDDPRFSSLGLVQAAVLGLVDPAFANTNLEFIPNMDGFPNGRRLEDDITRIELQAVSGVVLAAIGLWYDDFIPGESESPLTENLLGVLTYNAGVTTNDTTFREAFPYVQMPWSGTGKCSGVILDYVVPPLVPPAPAQQVIQFKVTTRDNQEVVDDNLMDGDLIDLSTLSSNLLNIKAISDPAEVGSVAFDLTGPINLSRTENQMPYFLFGDDPGTGTNFGQMLKPGSYTLTATPFSMANQEGEAGMALTINFMVVEMDQLQLDQGAQAILEESNRLEAFPNPVSQTTTLDFISNVQGRINLQLVGPSGQVIQTRMLNKAENRLRTQVDLSGLPTGNYSVQILQEGKVISAIQLLKAE